MKILRTLFGGGKGAVPGKAVDPAKVLFSLPTISGDDIAFEPAEPGDTDLVFHEDDWRQIEFFSKARAEELARTLSTLKIFAAERSAGSAGYRDIFARKLPAMPVLAGFEALERVFDAKIGPGPILFHGDSVVTGRVKDSFSLALAGKVWLYGTRDLSVLGAAMPPGADNEVLARAFVTLNRSDGLVLVDWRSQMLLVKVADDGNLEVWRP